MEEFMKEYIKHHLKDLDKTNAELDIITNELRNRISDTTDDEKQEILKLIDYANKQELSNYPQIQEIKEWLDEND